MNNIALQHTDISRYLIEIDKYPLLTPEEEYQLAIKYFETGDLDAARTLVLSNLRFVVKVAYQYRSYGLPLMDLVQEGTLGLMHSVQKFDPYKGNKLISYAVWWIKHYMQKYVRNNMSIVKRGDSRVHRKILMQLRKAEKYLNQEMEGQYTDYDIAEYLDATIEDINDVRTLFETYDNSLDSTHTYNNEPRVNNIASKQPSLLHTTIQKDLEFHIRGVVKEVSKTLSDREQYILHHRIMSSDPKSLQNLATEYGVSRERIRQIEKSIINQIKKAAIPVIGEIQSS